MGRKTSREIYVGGYNKEFYVDEMEVNHIVNSLSMIHRNIEAMEALYTTADDSAVNNIDKVVTCLKADQRMLTNELGRRELCEGEC